MLPQSRSNVSSVLEPSCAGKTVAQLVPAFTNKAPSYQEISRRTGASTATVTRVAQWLHRGEGGYRAVLKQNRR